MEKFDIKTLRIEEIREELYDEIGYIHFTVFHENKAFRFSLKIFKKGSTWKPVSVLHNSKTNDCPCCEKVHSVGCKGFRGQVNELFEKIVSHPKLRLRLLFGMRATN